MTSEATHCGYVTIIGRPNVGKSTLLNRILGEKISITSNKPQTTRYQILGIKTKNHLQAVYVDTPGVHDHMKNELNRLMNRAALSALADVDVVLFVVDASYWTDDDERVLKRLETVKCPIILILNKIDLMADRKTLLPKIEKLHEKLPNMEIIPSSALKGENIDHLEKIIFNLLPEGPHLFGKEQVTDRHDAFRISEMVREKITRVTGQEIPYSTAVNVESMRRKDNVLHIDAVIWVERAGQKKIIIGKQGGKLKEIGRQARLELEKIFKTKIYLSLWVKVKTGWSDDKKTLTQLGLTP